MPQHRSSHEFKASPSVEGSFHHQPARSLGPAATSLVPPLHLLPVPACNLDCCSCWFACCCFQLATAPGAQCVCCLLLASCLCCQVSLLLCLQLLILLVQQGNVKVLPGRVHDLQQTQTHRARDKTQHQISTAKDVQHRQVLLLWLPLSWVPRVSCMQTPSRA